MEELYDILSSADPTLFEGISKEDFVRDFQGESGLSELYDILGQTNPDLLSGIEKQTFISDFNTQKARGVSGEKNFLDLGILNNTMVGDFVDDIARGIARGNKSGDSVGEALTVMGKGYTATDQNIQNLITAMQEAESIPASEEFQNFIDSGGFETGKGWTAFIKNPFTIVGEIIAESGAAMFGNMTVVGAGVGGAVAGAAGGPLTAMPLAMFAASGALETGSKFSELLREEIHNQGKEVTVESIRSILEDGEKMAEMRKKALGRGLAVGIVDGLTARMAGSVGAKLAKAGKKRKAAIRAFEIEAAGGATGEGAAQFVAGEPLDVTAIGLEAIAEIGQGGPSVLYSLSQSEPIYKVNGEILNREEVEEIIDSYEPGTNIEISNDPDLEAKLTSKINEIRKSNARKGEGTETIPSGEDAGVERTEGQPTPQTTPEQGSDIQGDRGPDVAITEEADGEGGGGPIDQTTAEDLDLARKSRAEDSKVRIEPIPEENLLEENGQPKMIDFESFDLDESIDRMSQGLDPQKTIFEDQSAKDMHDQTVTQLEKFGELKKCL